MCGQCQMSKSNFRAKIDFLARGGLVGLVIEMKKGADDVKDLITEAAALINLGDYRAGLSKLEPALVALQTNGDEAVVVTIHLTIIFCHAALEEVS